MKVLVTGSSGLIGFTLISALTDQFNFSGLDSRKSDRAPDVPTIICDGSDYESMSKAFVGIDAVIHLAANAPVETPWADVLKNNISTTHNVYEACRANSVKRVIFASSNHAVGNFELDEPYSRIRVGDYQGLIPGKFKQIDHRVPVRPDSDYGVSKVFGEATGRYYNEHFGLEVACLRIGTVNPQNSPEGSIRSMATWLSHRDLTQLVRLCLTQPLDYEIFYGVSDNTWRFWDTDHAKKTIGYAPVDNAEDYR
jgi:NAD+ dependent glucose-6-phosphate dehydrogenase